MIFELNADCLTFGYFSAISRVECKKSGRFVVLDSYAKLLKSN